MEWRLLYAEAVDGLRLIGDACTKQNAREIRVMDCVGVMLGFKRKAGMAAVCCSVMPLKVHMLGRINLHAGLGGAQMHDAPALRIIEGAKAAHPAARDCEVKIVAVLFYHHGVFRAAGKAVPETQTGTEIYRQTVNGKFFSRRNEGIVGFGDKRSI